MASRSKSQKKQKQPVEDVDMDDDAGASSSSSQPRELPAHIKQIRDFVSVGKDAPKNTETIAFHGAFAGLGVSNAFDLEEFKKKFKIRIVNISANRTDLVMDLSGIDAPLANALRRILLGEVPTLAIEKVLIANNTSIVQDEVLAHRLGLIPLAIDPRFFAFPDGEAGLADGAPDPEKVVVFKLKIKCKRKPGASDDMADDAKYENSKVLSKHLQWVPIGSQAAVFADCPIRVVHEDILIAKLRPGQEIDLECRAVKGIGLDHAKFSPVGTATYRLLPHITLLKEIKNQQAEELVAKCPLDVFDIEDLGAQGKRARVARPRNCSMCRECIREDGWDQLVKLDRVKDHFIFSVESTGVFGADDIVREAIKVFIEKIQYVSEEFESSDRELQGSRGKPSS